MVVNPVLVAFLALAIAASLFFVVVRVAGARRQQASTGRGEMVISVLPRSSLGRWSVGLAIVFMLILIALQVWPSDVLSDTESNQALAVVLKIILIAISGVSLATGLISLVKRGESSVLVLVGMLITLWLGLVNMVAHFFME